MAQGSGGLALCGPTRLQMNIKSHVVLIYLLSDRRAVRLTTLFYFILPVLYLILFYYRDEFSIVVCFQNPTWAMLFYFIFFSYYFIQFYFILFGTIL
jgi:hypothetical protein